MAIYGNYETGEQLGEGPLTSLWEARPVGAAEGEPARYVVKVFTPSGTFLGADGQKFDLRPFLAAAQDQAKAAAAGSHWAPVHASGQAAGGAFYVTDRFSHSLAEILGARIRLTPPALHNIFASAIRGLLELHKACQRPHANLKPANILVEGSGAKARVALTDPLPPGELDEQATPAADLKALGEMLYQLVTGRPFVAKNCWPIGPSPEWNHYGDAWRGLCSRLLAPDMAAGPAELQAVAGELARLRPRAARGPLRAIAIALLATALVAGGAYLAWRRLSTRKPEPSAPEAAVEREASEWLAQVRNERTICRSVALNGEWRRRRDLLLPPEVSAPALAAEPQLFDSLKEQARTLKGFLAALDDQKALPTALPQLAQGVPDEPMRQAVEAALHHKREATLQDIVKKITWDESGKLPTTSPDIFKKTAAWRDGATAYLNWRLAAARALATCHSLATLLEGGWLPDDKPPGTQESIIQLLDQWHKLKAPSELTTLFQPTIARAEALAKITKLGRKALIAAIASPDPQAPPQAMLLAWRRLGEFGDWPATLDELRQEAAFEKTAAAIATRLKKKTPEAVRWAEAALPAESARRWEKVFNAIATRHPPGDFADKDLAAAEAIRQEARIAQERLAPATRLRLAIFRLRRSLGRPQQAARAAARSFVADVGKLPDEIRNRKDVAALLAALERILRESPKANAGQLFGTTGPAAARMGVRWTANLSPDGERAFYTWPGTGHKLVFARVEVPGQPNPSYLSTTEVPVGLFIDVVTAAKGWKALEGMLAARPEGPSVWEWVEEKGERRLRKARRWLEGFSYAPGVERSAPTENHPVQQLSAAAAVYFAWLLGCRLPTAAEWYAATKTAGAEAKPNLRDETWARQHAFLRKALAAGRKPPAWPDAGIFWPMGVLGKTGAAAEAVGAHDDGALWFQPVGSGERFSHLVGNVAEFVFEMPAAEQEALRKQVASFPPEVGGPFLRAALLKALEKNPALVGVVGGSALSAPEVWDGKGRPFEKPLPVGFRRGGRGGYSDVGFRLAFTAPGEPFTVRLRRLLAARGYLPGLR